MKLFLKKRISFILVLWLILAVLQLLLVFLSLDGGRSFTGVKNEVMMILLVFFLFQFSLLVLLNAVFPSYLKKYLIPIENLITEISSGSYNIEIDVDEFAKIRDNEMVETIFSIKKMLEIIVRFDVLKKEKIQEQRARIIALLTLTENGFIIINRKGDIIYVNYLISEYFPTIKEDMNILESNFSVEVDQSIKSYISQVIRYKRKQPPKNFFMGTQKRHIVLKSEIVRDFNGEFDGTIIGIYNLLKKAPNESQVKEDETSEKIVNNDPDV